MFLLASTKLFVLCTLAAAASAIPAASPSCATTQQEANFEDLPNNSILPGPSIPVGYKGLAWKSFIIADQQLANSSLPQLAPFSPPNYAVTISLTQLVAGTPLITTNYENSNVTSFTLQDFYYGCAINLGQGFIGLPASCLISVTGYRGNEKDLASAQEVCSHQFLFDSNILEAETAQFSGPIQDCADIQFATFQYSNTGSLAVANVDVGLGLDNVRYTTCGK